MGDVPAGCTALGVPAEIMDVPAQGSVAPPDSDAHALSDARRTVFGEVLGTPEFAAGLNFFAAGGNS